MLDKGQNLEDQFLSCSPSVYTAVGNRQALHFAILESLFSARAKINLHAGFHTGFAVGGGGDMSVLKQKVSGGGGSRVCSTHARTHTHNIMLII